MGGEIWAGFCKSSHIRTLYTAVLGKTCGELLEPSTNRMLISYKTMVHKLNLMNKM